MEATNEKITEHDIAIGGKTIHYATAGEGQAILLIHGLNFGWKQWMPNLCTLAHKYKVYAIDLPGAGSSSTIDLSDFSPFNDHVQIVEAFIAQLELSAPHIIGHSSGAWIALQMATRKRLKLGYIVAVGPFGFPAPFLFEQIPLLFRPAVLLLTKTALSPTHTHVREFLKAPLAKNNRDKLSEEMVSDFVESIKNEPRRHPLWQIYTYSELWRSDLSARLSTDNLKTIDTKVVFVVGAHDPHLSVDFVRASISNLPRVSLSVFADSGHIPSLEEPVLFNKLVIDFLK